MIILASASPRRRSLMKKGGYRFRVVPSAVREGVPSGLSAVLVVKRLALKKASAVAKAHPKDVVLGADTLVFIGGRVIGKPASRNHARQILRRLAGRWQKVYTGVAVVKQGGRWERSAAAVSRVKLRNLSEKDIDQASRKHLDKAGAYAIQQKNDPFVEKILGEKDNVEGLPLRVVRKLLRAAGEPLPEAV